MKNKRKNQTSQWQDLAWKKVNVNSSSAGDDDKSDEELDHSKFINAKNHYDDPNADPSELHDVTMRRGSNKYDKDDAVEGANDPGIFVGLEVIDGSQYQIEKVSVGKGTAAGYITHLVFGDTKGEKKESDDQNEEQPSKKATSDSSVEKSKKMKKNQEKGDQ